MELFMWDYLRALFQMYSTMFWPPTHCDVCGCKLEEYDYELYCPNCFKKAFEEEARRLKRTT
jgi:uncharacterized Zn finger protein (UPF0148 family)